MFAFLNRPINRMPYLGLAMLSSFLDKLVGQWFTGNEGQAFLLDIVWRYGVVAMWLVIIVMAVMPVGIHIMAVMKRGAALGWTKGRYIQCGLIVIAFSVLFVASYRGVTGSDYEGLTALMTLTLIPLHLVLMFKRSVAPRVTAPSVLVAAE